MKIDLRLLPEEERKKWEPIVKPKSDRTDILEELANEHLQSLNRLKSAKSPALRQLAEERIPYWDKEIKDLKENKSNQEGAE